MWYKRHATAKYVTVIHADHNSQITHREMKLRAGFSTAQGYKTAMCPDSSRLQEDSTTGSITQQF